MLLEFRVENYRCFADEAVLRLTASADTSHERNLRCSERERLRVLKSTAIYGANGSGKSTLLQAASFLRTFVLFSATHFQANDPIPVEPFLLAPSFREKPCSFEITFLGKDEVRFTYGFSVTSKEVVGEWLHAYPHGRRQIWFERKSSGWYFGPSLVGERDRIRRLTRTNALYLSTAANLGHEALTSVFSWFQRKLLIVVPSMRIPSFFPGAASVWFPNETADLVEQDPEMKEAVAEFLQIADVGIEDFSVEIVSKEIPSDKPGKREPIQLKRIRTKHIGTDGDVWFDLDRHESLGTKELFDVAGPWLSAIRRGGTLLVDEALSALHPLLVRHLLKLIHKSNAQLIMATHDTTLLDPELLRRDQVYFTEKDRMGKAHLYSLLEFKPRKNEAFARGYLSGRYGALPFIGDLEFDGKTET